MASGNHNIRFGIVAKLYTGLGLLLVLMALIAGVGWWTGHNGNEATNKVSEMEKDLIVAAHLQADLLMCRMNVKDFLITNSDLDIAQYDEYEASIRKSLLNADASFQHPERREALAGITSRFDIYDTTFDQVKQIIQLRNATVSDKLNVLGKQVADGLKQLNYEAIDAEDLINTHAVSTTLNDVFEGRLYVLKYLKTSAESDFERANSEFASAAQKIVNAIEIEDDPTRRQQLVTLKDHLDKYVEGFAVVRQCVIDRNDLVLGTLDKLGPEMAELVVTIEDTLERDSIAVTEASQSRLAKAITTLLVVSIFALVVGLFLAFFLGRAISKPIEAMIFRIKDIAEGEGDLTQRVDQDRKDELGELGKWFNTFVVKVHDIVAAVNGVSQEVADSTMELSQNSKNMAQSMDASSAQVREMSSAVEEMSQSIIEVARKSSEAADSATESGQIARQGGEVVEKTIDGMRAIDAAVQAGAVSVAELGQRGEQIGQVIMVINDIADQTNLLALNAAIEAARAGEHGRGFAVVADEVRKLADRTTKATEEIGESIKAIQTETEQAVNKMNIGTEQVNEGVSQAQEAGQSLSQIVSSADEVTGVIQSIAAAAEQQSAASEQISRNVDAVSVATQDASSGASEAAENVDRLAHKAEQLREMMSRFKMHADDRRKSDQGPPPGQADRRVKA